MVNLEMYISSVYYNIINVLRGYKRKYEDSPDYELLKQVTDHKAHYKKIKSDSLLLYT